MKKILYSFAFVIGFGLAGTAATSSVELIIIETASGQILEMPVYLEEAPEEYIPGATKSLPCNAEKTNRTIETAPANKDLSKILLCISKPESVEPFPFDLN